MSVVTIIEHYQRSIEKCSGDPQRLLHCMGKLYGLPISVQHLQKTGVGRTVNSLRKYEGAVGEAAKALVLKWKQMVAAEGSSDDDGEAEREEEDDDEGIEEDEVGDEDEEEEDGDVSGELQVDTEEGGAEEEEDGGEEEEVVEEQDEEVGEEQEEDEEEDEEEVEAPAKSYQDSKVNGSDVRGDKAKHSIQDATPNHQHRHHRQKSGHSRDEPSGSSIKEGHRKHGESESRRSEKDGEKSSHHLQRSKLRDEEGSGGSKEHDGSLRKSEHGRLGESKEERERRKERERREAGKEDGGSDGSRHHHRDKKKEEEKARHKESKDHHHRHQDREAVEAKKRKEDEEEDQKRKIEEEEKRKQRKEEEKRRQKEEEKRKRLKEEKRRLQKEEEERRKREAEEEAEMERKRVEEEERRREEEERKREEERRKEEEKQKRLERERRAEKERRAREKESGKRKEERINGKAEGEKSRGSTSSLSHGSEGAKEKIKSPKEGHSSKTPLSDGKRKGDKPSSSSKVEKSRSDVSDSSVHKTKKRKVMEMEDGSIDCGSGASFAEALGMVEPRRSKGTPSSPSKMKKKKETPQSSSNKASANGSCSVSRTDKSNATPTSSKPIKLEELSDSSASCSLLSPSAALKLEPLEVDIAATLPQTVPHYRPLPYPRLDYSPPRANHHKGMITEEEALSAIMNSKTQRTKVYSGVKSSFVTVPTLYELCIRLLQENIDALGQTGGVPYDLLKPVLERATPQQLLFLEDENPYLIEDTDAIWGFHCQKDFRGKRREEMESWRDMYLRCSDEREAKLKVLAANIKRSKEKSSQSIHKTKLAYVDTVAKPPRSVARTQAKFGTARMPLKPAVKPIKSIQSPGEVSSTTSLGSALSSASTSSSAPISLSAAAAQSRIGVVASSPKKPRVAPLMQKTLKFIKGRYKR